MFDWLGDIFGSFFKSENPLGSIFGTIGKAAFSSLSGTPEPQSLMRPKDIRDGVGPNRQYGNTSPLPNNTGAAQTASYDQITRNWERRMYNIMRKNAAPALDD